VLQAAIHLILTRFQPGDLSRLLMFEPFKRFLIRQAESCQYLRERVGSFSVNFRQPV
jgi:hypothetical protein